MSITFVKGDALKALKEGDIDYLVHCCNAQGVMNSGIAKQIREQVPEAYGAYMEQYEEYERNADLLMGRCSQAGGVINLIGQKYYGYCGNRYGHYGHIAHGLSMVQWEVDWNDFQDVTPVIGIPYKFASDRAGCDWNVILELIEGVLGVYFDVVIYHLENL